MRACGTCLVAVVISFSAEGGRAGLCALRSRTRAGCRVFRGQLRSPFAAVRRMPVRVSILCARILLPSAAPFVTSHRSAILLYVRTSTSGSWSVLLVGLRRCFSRLFTLVPSTRCYATTAATRTWVLRAALLLLVPLQVGVRIYLLSLPCLYHKRWFFCFKPSWFYLAFSLNSLLRVLSHYLRDMTSAFPSPLNPSPWDLVLSACKLRCGIALWIPDITTILYRCTLYRRLDTCVRSAGRIRGAACLEYARRGGRCALLPHC